MNNLFEFKFNHPLRITLTDISILFPKISVINALRGYCIHVIK